MHPDFRNFKTQKSASYNAVLFGLPSDIFPSGFLTQICHSFPISSMCVVCPAINTPRFDIPSNSWCRVQVMKVIIIYFSSSPVTSFLLDLNIYPCSETALI
jgi:hypothetical protein